MMTNTSTLVNKSETIILVDSKLSSGTVKSNIIVSKSLKKYFRCFDFFSRYDAEIIANNSILNIPVLSIVLPLAWITGADVYVNELDKTFAESMDLLQREYKKIYPRAPFKTKLVVDKLVKNKYAPGNTALLFSGGLDSTYSLFSNISLNPTLIMIFGVQEIPISSVTFQEILKTEYSTFAKREGLKINFIHTNALEILNTRRVDHLWWKFKGRHEGDFWGGLGYALGHVGQVAPLSIEKFNRLIIAASREETNERMIREHPHASSPSTDEKMKWANLQVKYDGCIRRHKKVHALKKVLNEHRIKFRVCWSHPELLLHLGAINCSTCEKCLRTIAPLLLAGIDPNECGFNVDDSTFNLMRTLFEQKKLSHSHITLCWKPLQRIIPDRIEGNLCSSRQFFEWFKTINLDLLARARPSDKSILSLLYHKFPYSISNLFRKFFYDSHVRSV